jgi:predicted GH43/DUF377 family glycosyl hydrolase
MSSLSVTRSSLVLQPDRTRVLARPFHPSTRQRAANIGAMVAALPESDVVTLLEHVEAEFRDRHVKIREFLRRRFDQLRPWLRLGQELSDERQLLLGAYFTHEYSLEAAALFNPSIVLHPDQSELPPGSLRFVLSLRATGEGHISSITFRTGYLDEGGAVVIHPPTRYCIEPVQVPNSSYEKGLFARKLEELGLAGELSGRALAGLGDTFTLDELRDAARLPGERRDAREQEYTAVARKILALAQSNYEVQFDADTRLSERVLFPVTPAQRNGIEDARFVRFVDDDGTPMYCATYTAYDGKLILPQFLETPDFLHFKFFTLNGSAARNKGMALFPRKINGKYAMLGRQDYESIYVIFSDHLHFWNDAKLVLKPKFPWELIQVGNCGSPIETDVGWLVLSHGVGPMRKYCIGAFLLDRDDPTRVLGRLREPLIRPTENEREGYVPNVVYSCGSLVHGKLLVIPYAMSDYASTFATVPLEDVLAAME